MAVSAADVGSASLKADWSKGFYASSWLRPSCPIAPTLKLLLRPVAEAAAVAWAGVSSPFMSYLLLKSLLKNLCLTYRLSRLVFRKREVRFPRVNVGCGMKLLLSAFAERYSRFIFLPAALARSPAHTASGRFFVLVLLAASLFHSFISALLRSGT